MGDGMFEGGYSKDYFSGLENYMCANCRADEFSGMSCGSCTHNDERRHEYKKKYESRY